MRSRTMRSRRPRTTESLAADDAEPPAANRWDNGVGDRERESLLCIGV